MVRVELTGYGFDVAIFVEGFFTEVFEVEAIVESADQFFGYICRIAEAVLCESFLRGQRSSHEHPRLDGDVSDRTAVVQNPAEWTGVLADGGGDNG